VIISRGRRAKNRDARPACAFCAIVIASKLKSARRRLRRTVITISYFSRITTTNNSCAFHPLPLSDPGTSVARNARWQQATILLLLLCTVEAPVVSRRPEKSKSPGQYYNTRKTCTYVYA